MPSTQAHGGGARLGSPEKGPQEPFCATRRSAGGQSALWHFGRSHVRLPAGCDTFGFAAHPVSKEDDSLRELNAAAVK